MQNGLTKPSPRNDALLPKYAKVKEYLVSQLAEGKISAVKAIPTEVQLAERLELSRTTVRRALADLEHAGLVQRIRGKGTFITEVARTQRALGGQDQAKTNRLFGLVLPEVQHGLYPALQESIVNSVGQLHGQTIVCDTDQDAHRQADILLQLIDRGVDGIAIVPTSRTDHSTPAHHIRPLQKMGIPVVLCHRGVAGISAPLVTYSGIEAGNRAGKALLSQGHRRIAFIGTHRSTMSEFYLKGLQASLTEAGVELPGHRVHFGTRFGHSITAEHRAQLREVLQRLLELPDAPTAIFTSFDSEAELIYLLLSELGVRVPREMSILGLGGALRTSAFVQQLTSIVVDEMELGKKAIMLLDEMSRGARPVENASVFTVPLSLSEGATLSPPGSGSANR